VGSLFQEAAVKIIPVALALFHRQSPEALEVWTQVRTDDGIYQGLLEFPGGGIEKGETPLQASIREVKEEVGIDILSSDAKFMGTYSRVLSDKAILLYLFLYPEYPGLTGKGQWLRIDKENLSSLHAGKIPAPNHQMIDDLYRHR
jgi:8-oxo-dGTP diphosphatase